MKNRFTARRESRRGATLVVTALLLVLVIGMIAFAVDVGYVVLVRTQLQTAADASAMAASAVMGGGPTVARDVAKQYASQHLAGGKNLTLSDSDIEFGVWDVTTRTFNPTPGIGNAIRVTARRSAASADGEADFFFARVFGKDKFSMEASAIAMANPRDIAFVVDLSGSMNDDTEPVWATDEINSKFAPEGFPDVGDDLMQNLYNDFGWGAFPGPLEYIGKPLGVKSDSYAYAEMTKNGGPLSSGVSGTYKINDGDSESTRKTKAYKWMIDYQIAAKMPNVKPTADSSTNYSYWEKYLDYILISKKIVPPKPPTSGGGGGGGGSSGGGGGTSGPTPPIGYHAPSTAPIPVQIRMPSNHLALAMGPGGIWRTTALPQMLLGASASPGTPPNDRGWLPPSQDGDRIHKFNNPNKQTFPSANSNVPKGFRNKIGYQTYAAFLMDHGRNLKPNGSQYTPLSLNSPDCPVHAESTPGGTFMFPPRSQPMHSARRAIIAAIAHVESKNSAIPSLDNRDWVSVIAYDTLDDGGPTIEQTLTGQYNDAMMAATTLQALGDKSYSTATESGLAVAEQHLKPADQGGQGRAQTDKIVVLLTDGVPNLYSASNGDIDDYMANNPSSEFYGGGYYWLDAALMKSAQIEANDWMVFPVGIGLGTDYDFMDRMARMGGSANDDGESPRGSGNPAEYEQRLIDIFQEIIDSPAVRLVE